MNYEILKNKIFYSKHMKSLEGKQSPIKGYSDAGSYARENQRLSNLVAINNGLDENYCSVLSLAQFLGLPPYGNEGKIAIQEILGEYYDQTEINIKRLTDIAGEPIEDRLKKDLEDIEKGSEENFSNEARCVYGVNEILEIYSLMNNEEKEKLGGEVLKTAMVTGMKKGTDGLIKKSSLQEKLNLLVKPRKIGINQNKKYKVKESISKRLIDSALDEQGIIEKLLGE